MKGIFSFFVVLSVLLVTQPGWAKKKYEFSLDGLQRVSDNAANALNRGQSMQDTFEQIRKDLELKHPGKINRSTWTFNAVGGSLAQIQILYCDSNEILSIWGSGAGTSGFSGRYKDSRYWDFVFAGNMWSESPGNPVATIYQPGDTSDLLEGTGTNFRLEPGTWMLDYGRGKIANAYKTGVDTGVKYTNDKEARKQQTQACKESYMKNERNWGTRIKDGFRRWF